MQNGVSRSYNDLTVAQIKESAKLHAQKVARNASPLSVIGAARIQIAQARTCENQGDLKGAYSAYIKAVSLIQTFMSSPEFRAESNPGKRGVLFKEYQDFQAVRFSLAFQSHIFE
jgi:ubiquitin carboxyl-terminal hydrolase 8